MKKIIFSISLLSFSTLFAQEKAWNLNTCIDYALENNLTIKRSILQYNSSEWDKKSSFGNFLPTLNGSVNGSLNQGRNIDPFTNEFTTVTNKSINGGLNTGLTLFNGGSLMKRFQNSKLNIAQQKSNLEQIKRDISMNIALAYLQVLFNKENLEMADDRLLMSKGQLEKTSIQVSKGAQPKAKKLEVEAQMYSDEQGKVNAEYALKSSKMQLFQLLDIRDFENQQLQIPNVESVPLQKDHWDIDKIYQKALMNLPKYKAAQLQKEIAENNIEVSKANGLPSLRLGANIGSLASDQAKTVDQSTPPEVKQIQVGLTEDGKKVFAAQAQPTFTAIPLGTQLDNNLSSSVSLSLNIPILNGFQTKVAVQKSKIAQLQAEIGEKETENQIYKDVQSAIIDAEKAFEAFRVATKTLESTQANLNNAEERYKLNAISIYDFQQIKNAYFSAKIRKSQAKYDYIFKRMVLEFYQGNAISLPQS